MATPGWDFLFVWGDCLLPLLFFAPASRTIINTRMSDPYVLSCDDGKHTGDVKTVAVDPSGSLVITASRDRTARVLQVGIAEAEEDSAPVLKSVATLFGHEQFVNFALYHPFVPFLDGEACIVTGSNDKHIVFWNVSTGAMEAVLDAHSDGVRSGTVLTPSGDLVTTGWDGTALVWDIASGRLKSAFTGHTTSVLCCVQVDHTKNFVTTGSGDKTLITWDADSTQAITVHKGHVDSVQSVCRIDDLRFASGGNDGQILLWTPLGPQPIARVGTHESIVFSLSWNPLTLELVSASEDRSVQVWNVGDDGEGLVIQSIQFPCTVWSVVVAANGDLFTGTSDGHVRGWTRDENRVADADLIVAYETASAAQMIDVKSAAAAGHSIDTSNMPPVSDLELHQGSREGDRKMFKTEGGLVEMYVWTSGRWDKLGTVVSGPDGEAYSGPRPRAKQQYNGKAYDYLFDLELEGQYAKVPYNRGQSIFEAAQDFINTHGHMGVSQMHKEEIQQFILNNLDPADAAQVGGGTAASAAASNNEFAFSAFARESAALAAQGTQAPMSWNEARQRMETQGQDVAFSTFAREGLEAKKQAAPAGSQAGPSPLKAADVLPTTPTRFEGFNADAAKTKIRSLCDGSDEFDATVDNAVALAQRLGRPGMAEGEQEDVLTCVCALYAALGEGNKFPALDLIRHIAESPAGAEAVAGVNSVCTDLLHEVLVATSESGPAFARLQSDAERIVCLRLIQNLLGNSPSINAALIQPILQGILSPCVRFLQKVPNGHVRAALLAAITNAAVTLPAASWDAGEGQVAKAFAKVVGEAVLFDKHTEHQAMLLLAAVAAVRVGGSELLVPALRTTLSTFVNSSRRAACRNLAAASNLLYPLIKVDEEL